MKYKKWVKVYMVSVLSVIALFALFNWFIDPLWTFSHSNRWNNAQPGFDERQQKTNRAYFGGLEQYDTLLLGSSRVTYINQHDFKGMDVYNYASVSMYPIEYKGWIDTAKKIRGGEFERIILGVDFWGTNIGSFAVGQINSTPPASHYLEESESPFYRYKMLFLMDTLDRSLECIDHSKHPGTTDYTRDNVKKTIRISAQRKQAAVNQQMSLYGSRIYGKAYRYNTEMAKIFAQLKKENPKTKFILFTTPIASPLFELMVRSGNFPDYKRWITQLVESFGEVYDFMGLNSITTYQDNYADLHHFYPYIGTLIADRITGTPNKLLLDDFGIRVTKENLQSHLEKMEAQAQKILKKK